MIQAAIWGRIFNGESGAEQSPGCLDDCAPLDLGYFFYIISFIFGMMDVARGTLIPLHARTDVDVAAAVAASASASAGNVAFT